MKLVVSKQNLLQKKIFSVICFISAGFMLNVVSSVHAQELNKSKKEVEKNLQSIILYKQPLASSKHVIYNGEQSKLVLLKHKDGWYRVNQEGDFNLWIRKNRVSILGNIAMLGKQKVPAYLNPYDSKPEPSMATISANTGVLIVARQGDWIQVKSNEPVSFFTRGDDTESSQNETMPEPVSQNETKSEPVSQNETTQQPLYTELLSEASESQEKTTQFDQSNFGSWVCSRDPEHFTIQLASFENQKELSAYQRRNTTIDSNQLKIGYSSSSKWYYLLYGDYSSIAAAKKVITKLKLTKIKPIIKPFSRIQRKRPC